MTAQPLLTLAAWVHDLDPVVFHLTPTFGPRWYGLAYVAGFAAAWWILRVLAKRGKILLSPIAVGDAMIALMVGVLVGGRIGYAAFYRPDLFISFTGRPPWWELLSIHEGGMASHGGMIGVVVAAWWIARREKVPFLHLLDALALVTPIGLFFGRVANFINGELLGRIVALPGQPAPWWAVKYPQELLSESHRPGLQPEQEDALGALLVRFAPPPGAVPDVTEAAMQRLITHVQAGDAALKAELAPLLSARHPSQLYQALAEGLVLLVVLWAIWTKPRKPGVVAAWFLMVYGALRVVTERFRLPDDHLVNPLILGLTRGQWLSLVMVAAGAALLAFALRTKDNPPVGGWRTRAGASKSA